MITEHSKKIAFAEGYYAGMIQEEFNNPYEDFDLRVQYNYGFRMATDRIDTLYANNVVDTESEYYA